MPSGCTLGATSTRCCERRASAGSTSTVTGAASSSRPRASGCWPSGPCHSCNREQDVRRAGDLERSATELRLDSAEAAREARGSLCRRYGVETHCRRPPPRGHLDEVLRARPGGRLLEPHHAGFAKAGRPRDGREGALILNRPPGAELIARPRHRRQSLPTARSRMACAEVGDKLKAVAAGGGIEIAMRKAKVFHHLAIRRHVPPE